MEQQKGPRAERSRYPQSQRLRDPSNAVDYKSFYRMALEDPEIKQIKMNDWLGLRLKMAFIYKYGLKLMWWSLRHFSAIIWKYKK